MNYDLLLFDADDTLLDFKRSEAISFQAVLEKNGLPFNEQLYSRYKKINQELWANEALGLISKDFLKIERYRKFLEEFNLEGDPVKLCEDYLVELPERVFLIEEALSLLQSLHKKIPMAIVTNGIGHVQIKRMHISGLNPYIDLMIISEECGFSKPDPRIFEHTLKKLNANHSPSRILMVGDKLETDILGASKMGFHSCWFNPDNELNKTSITPTHQINKLSQLLEIV